jgi:hypothetical protein
MTFAEGILIAVVIILTVVVIKNGRKPQAKTQQRTWDCVDRKTGDVTSVKMQYTGPHGAGCQCSQCVNPEKMALRENSEYFTNCQDPAEQKQALSCMCDDDDKFQYAVNEFGAPGLEFKDWATSQAVDPQVLKNHHEFVKDRLKDNSQNITGRTFSLGELESDQITWQGIRGRPVAVNVCSPTQIADVNYDWYASKPRFNWTSS